MNLDRSIWCVCRNCSGVTHEDGYTICYDCSEPMKYWLALFNYKNLLIFKNVQYRTGQDKDQFDYMFNLSYCPNDIINVEDLYEITPEGVNEDPHGILEYIDAEEYFTDTECEQAKEKLVNRWRAVLSKDTTL